MEKKIELNKLNMELNAIKESLSECTEELSTTEKDLARKKQEARDLESEIEASKAKISQNRVPKKKKYVQTSLFEPISKKERFTDLLNIIKEIDIKSDIPDKLKDQIIELKKELEKIN